MIIPLFMERLLLLLVGVVDSFIISYAGEAAVSGVSLVNQLNNVFIMISNALASGGAIVISHYIGDRKKEEGNRSASQLLLLSVCVSLLFLGGIWTFDTQLLHLTFGKVEHDVMEACMIYLGISVWSYPAQAIYDSGAALYRSMGKTKTTMNISIQSNMINVVGNIIGVFVLHMGVAGVAIPTLVARIYSAAAITILCFQKENEVHYQIRDLFHFDHAMLHRIMRIALPNSVESGVFNFVKIAVTSIVAAFGTYQIAANGVAQNIWSIANTCSNVMGPVFITVIGQCMGAHEPDTAEYYYRYLLRMNLWLSFGWNALIAAATPVLLYFYALSPQTKMLILQVVLVHNFFNTFISPSAMPLGNGLRAAGDVRFSTKTALISSVIIRLSASWFLGQYLGWGLMGITLAMISDWSFRAICYRLRLRSGKWRRQTVI